MSDIDTNTKKLAAIAYGEASSLDDADEIGGVAFAVANRARAWGGKTIEELLAADKNYTYAINGTNARFNLFMAASEADIKDDDGMTTALEYAKKALSNQGTDPSNGAFWWDGVDFKTNYDNHPKVKDGFAFGNAADNIFKVKEKSVPTTIYWQVRDKKTGKIVNSKVRGTFKQVWISTAAHGKTIFWKHDADYLKATGGKAYR